MNFKANHIFNQLKHNPKHHISKLMPDDALFTLLWYFVSKESYAQRTTMFDSIFGGSSSPYDRFFLMWIYRKLALDELRVYTNNMMDLDVDVDALSSSDLQRNLLYLHANGITSFTSYFEKTRNSIAHGTFNKSNRFFMVGQKSSKQNSVMNFYYQTSNEFCDQLKNIVTSLESITDIKDLCEVALKDHPDVEENDGFLYYREKRIVIEHNYKFKPVKEFGSEISQIKELVKERSYSNTLIILCCVTHGSFDNEELNEKNIGVIPYTHLHTFFNYNIEYKT